MGMMGILTLILFFIVTGIHLYASLKQDRRLRNMTKPFILLLLLAWYCLSANKVLITVVLALLFSWIGDVLLMPRGVKWFTAGGISFMVSHFFFILTYARMTDFAGISRAAMILLPLVFFGAMNSFAWILSMSTAGAAGIITAVGALLFYVSDSSLFFVRFDKNSRLKTHFLVMLTYSLGELLIVLGLIL